MRSIAYSILVALAAASFCGCSSAPAPAPAPAAVGQADLTAQSAAKLSEAGNWTAAEAAWQQALERFRRLHDRRSEAVALHNLAQAKRELGHLDEAHALLEESAKINRERGQTGEWWRNQVTLLQLETQMQNADAVAARFKTLQAEPPPASQPELQGLYWNELGHWQQTQGETARAVDAFARAGEAFRKAKDPAGEAAVLANRASLDESRKDFASALERWQTALASFQKLADELGIALALMGEGRCLVVLDRNLDRAEHLLRRAADNCKSLKQPARQSAALDLLHQCLLAEKKTAEAEKVATERQSLSAK